MAKIVTHRQKETQGKERSLSVLARAMLVMGIGGILICTGFAAATGKLHLLITGGVLLFSGLFLFVILDACAEMIRLMKKVCDIPYSGPISGQKEFLIFRCSACSAIVDPDSIKCDNCGAEFDHISEEKGLNNDTNQ
ncbi:MAG: hypothetical protein U9P80_00900 [Thermodesulfobacteriota bacterium]|nr:hypothetical protein [Thermodesulfobacteriota bacterium]